jgi:hypothetical protein
VGGGQREDRKEKDLWVKDGRTELARLEAAEPAPILSRALLPSDIYRAEPGDHVADESLRRTAERLGFRYLGRYSFQGAFFRRPQREMWVDREGVVALSMRSDDEFVARMMSDYILGTVFDDGDAIETYSKSPAPVPSRPRAKTMGGSGDLAADYEMQLAVVRRRCAERAALSIRDLDTALASVRWQTTRLSSVAGMRFSNYVTYATMAAIAGLLVFERTHHHHVSRSAMRGVLLAFIVVTTALSWWAKRPPSARPRPGP